MILSYLILSYHIILYLILSCLIVSDHIISYLIGILPDLGDVVGEGACPVVDQGGRLQPAVEGFVDLLEHALHRTLDGVIMSWGDDGRHGAGCVMATKGRSQERDGMQGAERRRRQAKSTAQRTRDRVGGWGGGGKEGEVSTREKRVDYLHHQKCR